ncbi:MAG: GGDEF domain-containing protein [Acidimicrobiia bacterium]|nr:GGDEF domain-containing protein [Acidimicrobiia bacterium]
MEPSSNVAGWAADAHAPLAGSEHERFLRQVTDLLPTGLAIFDLDASLSFSNPRWAELTGRPAATAGELVEILEGDRDEAVALLAGLRRCVEAGTPFSAQVTIDPPGTGAARRCTFTTRPLRDDEGHIVGVLCYLDDVTDLWRAGQQLRVKAETDELTGLLNRATIIEFLDRTLEGEAEGGNNTAVFFIDLNRFKSVNDEHGHAAGDRVLQQVASYLQRVTRRVDRVGRLGGDEFVVVCPLAGEPADVMRLAHRIASGLHEEPLPAVEGGTVGWSIGVALDRAGDHSAQSLLAEADAAMYEQKQCGSSAPRLYLAEDTRT